MLFGRLPQVELVDLFDTGGTDGVVGPDTTQAIRRFQATQGVTPDGFASAALLQTLR